MLAINCTENITVGMNTTVSSLLDPSVCDLGPPSWSKELVLRLDVALCVIYSCFTLTAILTNSIVIIAIWKTKRLRSPSIILLCFLAATDLLTGLIVGPAFIASSIVRIKLIPSNQAGRISVASSYTSATLSVLTLTLISLDKVLALYLHLRYDQLVRNRNVFTAGLALVMFCCGITVARVLLPTLAFEVLDFLIFAICLIINVVAYCYIFKIIRKEEKSLKYERNTAARFNKPDYMDVRRHKKSSITMAGLTALCIVCFVANFVVKLFTSYGEISLGTLVALDFSDTALFVLATINPLCYSYRLTNVRKAIANILKYPFGGLR